MLVVSNVRIDKYLKLTRIIKRRTVAKEIVDDGVIFINGSKAKPAKEVKVGDIVKLQLGQHLLTIKVLALNLVTKKDNASEMYEVLEDRVINPKDEA